MPAQGRHQRNYTFIRESSRWSYEANCFIRLDWFLACIMATPCQASTTWPPPLLKTDCLTDRRGGGGLAMRSATSSPPFCTPPSLFLLPMLGLLNPPSPPSESRLAQPSTHVMALPSPSPLPFSNLLVAAHLLVLHTWHAVRHDRAVADLQEIPTFERHS